ncbi:MAG: EcoAI/FtnUII family type I restriction enzme subunit R [Vampirovibrionales bacterium]
MTYNEENTKKNIVNPKLEKTGWFEHSWQVDLEYRIADGKIEFDGYRGKRDNPLFVDYLLRYRRSKPIAVIEAKKESLSHLEGEAQAKKYATKLGVYFAYATNGHQIEFYNLKAGTQETVDAFHTPEALWQLYLHETGLEKESVDQTALIHDYYDESTIGQKRKPRYYQEKAVNNAIEAILQGQNRVLIAMATGTGKTFTSIQLVYKLWKAKTVEKVLFIVDRNILAQQAYEDFDKAMDQHACFRLEASQEQFPLGRDLYFGIYQTLVGVDDEEAQCGKPDRFKEFPPDYFDLIIIDEAHRGARRSQDGQDSSSWYRLLEYFDSAIHVGLTATPKRDESNDTYAHFGEPVVSYSLKEGIQDGYLAPYVVKRVTSNIDALGYRPERVGLTDVRGKTLSVQDYLTPDFERLLSIPQRTRAFAYHLLRHLFDTDPLGKTIVFCVNQEHALDMAKYCKEAFQQFKERYGLKDYTGDYAVRITGADKDNKGKYPELDKFKDFDAFDPIVVTTSKLLTTGVDVKNVKNIVIFRNIGSMTEFKQIIGRGTRIYESTVKQKQKLGFYILEYANYSTQLFSDPDWDDEPVDFINEGALVVSEDPLNVDAVPLSEAELEAHSPTEDGLYAETDEERLNELKFRMSEAFLSGRIEIVAETTEYCGADGKPISPEQYVMYQSTQFLQAVPTLDDFHQQWTDLRKRKKILHGVSGEQGLELDKLTTLFFDRHKIKNVDTYDVLAHLVFQQAFLTKELRIQKARELNPQVFVSQNSKQEAFIQDVIDLYQAQAFKPLDFSSEFYTLPQFQEYGGFDGIKTLMGGFDALKQFTQDFTKALYDERIHA